MLRRVIIADDLTGANATAALMAKRMVKAITLLDESLWVSDMKKQYEAAAISTNSRGVEKESAYEAVKLAMAPFLAESNIYFTKRIDSTLRGNVGAETDALLDALGEDYTAMVVAAFPSSGRVTIGGYLLVNNIPLEKTDAAKDVKAPIHTSFVPDIFKKQSRYDIGHVGLQHILAGRHQILKQIQSLREQKKRILVFDATTEEDIELIAKAILESGLKHICVDPGPFTNAMSGLLQKGFEKEHPKLWLTIGSVTNLTRKQVEMLNIKRNSHLIKVSVENLLDAQTFVQEAEMVLREVRAHLSETSILGVVTSLEEQDVFDLKAYADAHHISEEETSGRINEKLALLTQQVLAQFKPSFKGLYTSGGDVTVAVMHQIHSTGFHIKEEIMPLAVGAEIVGGEFEDLPIVTKGGLIGDENALVKITDGMIKKLKL